MMLGHFFLLNLLSNLKSNMFSTLPIKNNDVKTAAFITIKYHKLKNTTGGQILVRYNTIVLCKCVQLL